MYWVLFWSLVDQDDEDSLDQIFLEALSAALPSIRSLTCLGFGHLDRLSLFYVDTKSRLEEGWARMMAVARPIAVGKAQAILQQITAVLWNLQAMNAGPQRPCMCLEVHAYSDLVGSVHPYHD